MFDREKYKMVSHTVHKRPVEKCHTKSHIITDVVKHPMTFQVPWHFGLLAL